MELEDKAKQRLIFKKEDFNKFACCSIPDHIARALASYVQNKYDDWCHEFWKNERILYGRYDSVDGWEMHESQGDMDTHSCRAFGFEQIKGPSSSG